MSTGIEWTDETWNPVTGCSKVSPGCANCYAETLALTRLAGKAGYPGLPWTPENAAQNVVLRPERLRRPFSWREPRMVFVNSMSDLFHDLVPVQYIADVFAVMSRAERHTFQVLTKRPERMARVMGSVAAESIGSWIAWPPPNVWLGTSIENDRWTVRADDLRAVPGDWTRFLSCEPLLGPLPSLDLTDIDWVIVGGESGEGHRPIDQRWVRDIRDRCVEAGIAFFFKQWGGRTPKAGGRLLDGREWNEMPARQAVAA